MANAIRTDSPWKSKQPFQVVGKPLGSGSFGQVWKAKHQVDSNYYAIKKISVEETIYKYTHGGDFKKLIREVKHLEKITSTNVVKYHNCWLEGPLSAEIERLESQDTPLVIQDMMDEYSSTRAGDNFLFIQMEYCDSTLKNWLEIHPTLEDRMPSVVSQILMELAEGLKAIHYYGIIHRDLKPDNIFLKNTTNQRAPINKLEQGSFMVKIGDFGLSTDILKEIEGKMKSFAGCSLYKSPEMEMEKDYDEKSDVFSLGLVFLETLFSFSTQTQKTQCFSDIKYCNTNNTLNKLIPKQYQIQADTLKKMLIHNVDGRIDSESTLKMLQGQSYKSAISKNRMAETAKSKKKVLKQPTNKSTPSLDSNSARNNIKRPIRFQIQSPISTFTGRTKELHQIAALFKHQKPTHLKNLVVLEGLGGIGKTNLARKFAEIFFQECRGDVIWILAENPNTLALSWKELLESKLKIPFNSEKPSDALETFYDIFQTEHHSTPSKSKNKSKSDVSKSASAKRIPILKFPPPPTLIILDNAEVFKKSKGSNISEIYDYLPHSHNFYEQNYLVPYFLITTRKHDFITNCQKLKVTPLLLEEAMEFVQNVLADILMDTNHASDVEELCETLQNFPLALQQAVAYIRENQGMNYSIKSYIDDFKTKKAKLLLAYEFADSTDDTYELTTLITWNISLEKIKNVPSHGQICMEVMQIIAYLPAENIPTKFIKAILSPKDQEFSTEDDINAAVLDEVFTIPQKYSMYTLNQSKVSVHRLVQKVIQISLVDNDNEEHIVVLRKLMAGCNKLLTLVKKLDKEDTQLENDSDSDDTSAIIYKGIVYVAKEILTNLYPCILSAWSYAQKHKVLLQEFYQFPLTLIEITSNSVELYQKSNRQVLVEWIESTLSAFKDDLPACLKLIHTCKNELQSPTSKHFSIALPIPETNRAWELIYQFELKYLGPDHPETVKSLEAYASRLAPIYITAEITAMTKKGVQLYEMEYHRRKRIHGPDDESTLTILGNLALATVHMDALQGFSLYKNLLSAQRKKFGVLDKRTVHTLKMIADLHRAVDVNPSLNTDEKKIEFLYELLPCFKSLFEYEKKECEVENIRELSEHELSTLGQFGYGITMAKIFERLKVVKRAVEVLDAIVKLRKKLFQAFPSEFQRWSLGSENENAVISQYGAVSTFKSLQTQRIMLVHEELMISFSRCVTCHNLMIPCQHQSENPKVRNIVSKVSNFSS